MTKLRKFSSFCAYFTCLSLRKVKVATTHASVGLSCQVAATRRWGVRFIVLSSENEASTGRRHFYHFCMYICLNRIAPCARRAIRRAVTCARFVSRRDPIVNNNRISIIGFCHVKEKSNQCTFSFSLSLTNTGTLILFAYVKRKYFFKIIFFKLKCGEHFLF